VGCTRAQDALWELAAGDMLAAYLRRCGYVGVGIVLAHAQPLHASQTEYALPVRWLRTVDREDACWMPRRGLFVSPQITALLSEQTVTLRYLQNAFGVRFDKGSNCKPSWRLGVRNTPPSLLNSTNESLLIPY
jgi:hypothetical protein